MKAIHLVLAAGLLGSVGALDSRAVPVPGAPVLVPFDARVTATFTGYEATFSSDLYLDSPAGAFVGVIFNNQTTPVGTSVALGSFPAGTELVFRVYVRDTHDEFFSGDPARNRDGVPHAAVDDAYGMNTTYVGFEDLYGGGDQDYNDLAFILEFEPLSRAMPEAASTAGLLLMSLGGLLIVRRRCPVTRVCPNPSEVRAAIRCDRPA